MKLWTSSMAAAFLCIIPALGNAGPAKNKAFSVFSPDKRIECRIEISDRVSYSVYFQSKEILSPSPVSLTINDNVVLGKGAVLSSAQPRSVDEKIFPPVKMKRAVVADRFRELTLNFRGNYGMKFRVYDDGVAYRFFTGYRRDIKINAEEVNFNFSGDYSVFFPLTKGLHTSFESNYSYLPLAEIGAQRFGYAPAVVDIPQGPKVAVAEADLEGYPGMFLTGNDRGLPLLTGKFAPYPLEEALRAGSDRELEVTKPADYLAVTKGGRSFPWRVLVIAEKDGDLIESDILYRLAGASRVADASWIKPGKVAWDWWNANNIYGVDFPSGLNTETYLHYIDFASRHGIEYVILDEGWSDPADLFKLNPAMDMERLLAHAREKNVGIILWCVWLSLDKKMNAALDLFQKWGIKGVKVDFMDRDDQKMVDFYWRCAAAAAKRRLLVDFHGAHEPAGLHRAYPNVLTCEGVMGLEFSKWSDTVTPDHDLCIPFIRMLAGPMDFTPGAMRNATQKEFRPVFENPMSQGTRAHQMAMYIVYESPLQMLCDSPSNYSREPEMMDFLSKVPTVWDETKVLDGKIGDQVIVARRSGGEWYIGAMTDWTPRTLAVDLGFLEKGEYRAEIIADGVNAARAANDYKKESRTVSAAEKLEIELAPGGGWAARLIPVDR